MTTAPTRPVAPRSAADIAGTIVLILLGFIATLVTLFVDIAFAFTSADSPGDVDGAFAVAFSLLLGAVVVWLGSCIVSIVFMVRRRVAWLVGLIALLAPVLAGVGGFIAFTSVVK